MIDPESGVFVVDNSVADAWREIPALGDPIGQSSGTGTVAEPGSGVGHFRNGTLMHVGGRRGEAIYLKVTDADGEVIAQAVAAGFEYRGEWHSTDDANDGTVLQERSGPTYGRPIDLPPQEATRGDEGGRGRL